MNQYPHELKTPPLPLVLLLGYPQLHAQLKGFLSGELRPPVQALTEPETAKVAKYFEQKKEPRTQQYQPQGILKEGWLEKRRNQRPAVAAVFVKREDIALSDPNRWRAVIQQLIHVKECCDRRGAKFIIVSVASTGERELPADRATALVRSLNIDPRSIVPFGLPSSNSSDVLTSDMKAFSMLVLELAWAHYQASANSIVSKHSQRTLILPEVNTWVSFKLGVLSEFRQDWVAAVKHYQVAYNHLLEVHVGEPVNTQRFVEVVRVAEQIHLKLVTILIHQKRTTEGINQFWVHMARFKNTPGIFSPGVFASHLGWVSHQYEALSDLLQANNESDNQSPLHTPCHPAHLLYCAADAAIQRRLEIAASASQVKEDAFVAVKGPFVGQVKAVVDADMSRDLTDEEFDDHLLALESKKSSTEHTLGLLTRAFKKYRGYGMDKKIYHLGMLMVQEHLASNDAKSARKRLLQVSPAYRSDGWDHLLSSSLTKLRECAVMLDIPSEHLIYSLELSTMASVLELNQREVMAKEALDRLLGKARDGDEKSDGDEKKEKFEYHVDPGQAVAEQQDKQKQVPRQDAGWSRVLTVAAGFAPVDELPRRVTYGLALRNNTPVDLPVSKAVIEFQDGDGHRRREEVVWECNTTERDDSEECGPSHVVLPRGKWKRSIVTCEPRCPGDMKAESLSLYVGTHAVVRWRLDGSDSQKSEDENPFREPLCVVGLNAIRIRHVGALPTITVCAPRYSLVGEKVPMSIEVSTDCPMGESQLVLSAEAAESSCNPSLTSADDPTSPSKKLSIAVKPLDRGETWTSHQQLFVDLPGQVTIKACLTLTEHCVMDQSLDVVFEKPFCLTSHFSSPVNSYLLMPPEDSTPSKPTNPQGSTSWGSGDQEIQVPANEQLFFSVCLESVARCKLEITAVEFRPPSSSETEVNPLFSVSKPSIFRKGDVQTLLYSFSTSKESESSSLGSLAVQWRRCDRMELHQASTSTLDSGRSSPTVRGSTSDHDRAIETVLPLPLIRPKRPLMSILSSPPPSATAGTPFPYLVQLSNDTVYPEELEVLVHDAEGCLFTGERNTSVMVLPSERQKLSWEVVAFTAGVVRLPKVRVTSTRMKCWVEVEGSEMYVMPVKV
ncbi:hypothetical protein BSKO_07477 [Bryopsis sp. KO-2023]|nr:hypothetical protein BSKO_07477 [Bryopsis sp. KO-2023]